MTEQLDKLEADLHKVQGVKSVRIVGDPVPTEIHIVADPHRPAKQVVRDVQSLAAAGHGMPIDHRIVSIVQLEDRSPPAAGPEGTPPPPPPTGPESAEAAAPEAVTLPADVKDEANRPKIDRIILASQGESGWVKVALAWPDGAVTEGAGRVAGTRDSRARGAMTALLHALRPALEPIRAVVEVDHVGIQKMGDMDSVLVRGLFYENGSPVPVVGSALVRDDVATAAVQALLHAINRKIEISPY